MATGYSGLTLLIIVLGRLRREDSDFKASLGYRRVQPGLHSECTLFSSLSQGSAKSRHPFQQSNSPRRHEKTGPWCHTPDSPLQAPLHRQTSERTNDFSNLWPPTLSFKDGFERTVKSQIISGPSVTLLSAPTLERRTPHRPVCSHYAVQTCTGSLGNNMAHG